MKIETKLDVGDTGFFLMQGKVWQGEIDYMDIKITSGAIYTTCNLATRYWIKSNPCGSQYTTCFHDYEFFATKEELLQSL